ncbi:ATP-dependent DNA helicase RecG [Neptunicoccus cionae]|uniref:Probable DNA 3'-5' helicase RecG n=1 Tax=Neptunicoccus cionae TaxID=2035344 RepID=A0A916QUU5_9RHOB|nr:ATP-dependent DNA helicase RecG [Amylibacter cionae]GGA11497.1 ATP-dependent DNA helicase RecG [Amylibacter cionae]
MSRRPEILFPLFADLTMLEGIGPKSAQNYAKIDINRPRDLLFLLPHSLINRQIRASILEVEAPAVVTVEIVVGIHTPNAIKGRPYRVTVQDSQTSFQLVFFHARSDWLREQLPSGQKRVVSGKIEMFDSVAQMVHPDYILPPDAAGTIPANEPLYPLTAGVSQKQVFRAARSALRLLPDMEEWITPSVITKFGWPSWKAAVETAHAPTSQADVQITSPSRARLAYDEFFAHQITLALARNSQRRSSGLATKGTGALRNKVLKSLPYAPTNAQLRAFSEITEDMASKRKMNRLLQGDVGSGKTLVALIALLAAVESGGQGVLMAPTEILARQHVEGLQPLASEAGVVLELLTGRDSGAERRKKLEALAKGNIQILVGTHAVFQKDVQFQDLRLAVIDEQHRFGVRQRLDLGAKGAAVDVLVMTATPIPRSLELANYGDMDVSVLDEKPAGRKPIDTVLVSNKRLEEVVTHLRNAISEGRQAYWVCPLVGESETKDWAATEERYRLLRLALGEENVGMVHGQMPAADKDAAMADFVTGRSKVLVATTVIEVGVNVPTASIMVIEQAESFGLAQLHQLRGRVGRGSEASTCLLMYGTLGKTAERRLKTMRDTNDGFRIADEDLKIRGAGDVLGVAQSGLPRFRIANLERQSELMKTAQDDARLLLGEDPDLTSKRGQAARVLLYLMEQEKSFRYISVG